MLAESVGAIDPALVTALQSLQSHGRLRVAALVNGDDVPTQVLRHTFPDATLAASLSTVVAPPGALVVLVTPPHLHSAQVATALKRGWHVLSVTPLARTTAEAKALIATAQKHDRLLAVTFPRRFLPALQYVRTLCRDQIMGPVLSVNVHDGVPFPGDHGTHARDGVLTDLGIPAFDLLTWCLGTPSVVNYADDAMGGVEANALVELAFPEDVHGRIHLSRDWPTSQSFEFIFERGTVQWNVTRPHRLRVQLASTPGTLDATVEANSLEVTEAAGTTGQGFSALLQNVIAAINRPTQLQVPASAALASLGLVDECHRRRTLLHQPWLSPNEATRARHLAASVSIGQL